MNYTTSRYLSKGLEGTLSQRYLHINAYWCSTTCDNQVMSSFSDQGIQEENVPQTHTRIVSVITRKLYYLQKTWMQL